MSLSDFLLGLAFMYPCTLNLLTIHALETYNAHIYTLTCSIRNHYYMCLVGHSPMITSMLNSMFTLLLLAIDKYVCIVKPYAYLKQEQSKWTMGGGVCLSGVWCVAILVSLLPLMGFGTDGHHNLIVEATPPQPCMFERIFTLNYILLFTGICGLCALFILTIYVRIYMIARKHFKQIERQQLQIVNNGGDLIQETTLNDIVNISNNNPIVPTYNKNINSNMKAMKTLLILLLGFYICWLPLIVYFLSFATQKYNNLTIHILMFVACCNAIVDPLVYSFRNK